MSAGDPSSSNAQIFEELLNSLRQKYKSLYDSMKETYDQIMEESIARKPDALENSVKLLSELYRKRYSQYQPFPWYPDVHVDIEQFAKPVRLLNEEAKIVNIKQVLEGMQTDAKSQDEFDQRTQNRLVLIQGETGSGKTFMANQIAYQWAKSENVHWPKMLIQLDCTLIENSLPLAIQTQILGKNFKRLMENKEKDKLILPETEREIWHMLEAYQNQILFLLDNYTGAPEPWLFQENWRSINPMSKGLPTKQQSFKEDEITKLLKGTLLPKARIILVSNTLNVQSKISPQDIEILDEKQKTKHMLSHSENTPLNKHLTLFGLVNKDAAIELVENYALLTKRPKYLFMKMLEYLGVSSDEETKVGLNSEPRLLAPLQ
ncbi:hypothetical protein Ciccas_010317 [Cichlidogyrus casuarinus]|uniref:AAA+ ATPase domain-containing protein n=1 Tax=Cichlidogyrus casuarinus TaxID=1844966 RepID=A0ABD2PUG5_9PLAT